VTVDTKRDYVLSAWVYRIGEGAVEASYQLCDAAGTGLGSPVRKSFATAVGTWERIEWRLAKSQYSSLPERGTVKIAIDGAAGADFCVDDIRFHPENALVKTFYYDQDLKLPIAFVDENHRALYFTYDGLGRLIRKEAMAMGAGDH
jgi:YD repeat-containing protein